MRPNKVRELWNNGQPAVSAWLSIGNSYSAELIGACGVDAVTVDLQHGMIDPHAMIPMLQAISATPATPFVRVPSVEAAVIMKVLDAGAYGLICPLVNSADEARALVEASSYPPRGNRSFGPARGFLYGGADYASAADETVVRLAMIETRQGLEAVDDICAVAGLDGIFVGPNDLALNLGSEASSDPTDQVVVDAIGRCVETAYGHGKHAGIFCPSGKVAARRIAEGFDFVVPNSEANLLKSAVEAEVAAARDELS